MSLQVARMFLCARCAAVVVLCTGCDRGNVYCGRVCAQMRRRASLVAAGRRYQASRAGRLAHAARARRYRARRKKVTHHGSAGAVPDAVLVTESMPLAAVAVKPDTPTEAGSTEPRCSLCGAPRSPAVRQGWLRYRHRNRWSPG